MAHYQIKRWDTDAVIYEGEAETLMDLANTAAKKKTDLYRARLDGARLDGARLDGARLDGARLDGARLVGARLDGASLDGASLDGARLDGASLDGASLDGASLRKGEIIGLLSFSGLYKYHILAYVLKDGAVPCVKMGCLDFTLPEWEEKGGILESNLGEFPNDGGYTSLQRQRAFEYAKAEVMAIKAKIESEIAP